MNQLSLITQAVRTMSSREIAALTGKAHPKVTADVEVMLAELGEDAAAFRRIYFDSMNRLGGVLTAHAPHIDAGRFAVTTGTSDVSGHAYTSARFTAKGIEWVAGEWAKFNLRNGGGLA